MSDRISSLDSGYQTGDLSLFPEALDDKDVLYEATNNSTILLKQTVSFNSKVIIVEDTTGFPDKGHLRIGPEPGMPGQYEFVSYEKRTKNTFQNLKRGFAGSSIGQWPAKKSWVSNTVFADHHNAIKDAIINIEQDLGLIKSPDPESLNGILKAQEVRFLAPKPLFRAYPIKGPPQLKVRFQNFTTGYIARYLWDFGDGGTSLEKSPTHTYVTEGVYTVKLNVVTTTGAQGIATKIEYIVVDSDEALPFFYVDSVSNPYSTETSNLSKSNNDANDDVEAKEFRFIDQSDGDIVQRNWIFGDGTTYTEEDPDVHEVTHVYQKPGEYIVTELIQFSTGRLKRVELPEPLVVL
jgi:PKD repeat protein